MHRYKTLETRQRYKIVQQLKRQGLSNTAIAKELGLSISRISQILKTPNKCTFDSYSQRLAEILDRYNNGQSPSAIAYEMGISRQRVSQLLKREGINPRGDIDSQQKQIREDIVELYLQGVLPTDIAQKLNIRVGQVYSAIAKYKKLNR